MIHYLATSYPGSNSKLKISITDINRYTVYWPIKLLLCILVIYILVYVHTHKLTHIYIQHITQVKLKR
jgi:hypothetical protein